MAATDYIVHHTSSGRYYKMMHLHINCHAALPTNDLTELGHKEIPQLFPVLLVLRPRTRLNNLQFGSENVARILLGRVGSDRELSSVRTTSSKKQPSPIQESG